MPRSVTLAEAQSLIEAAIRVAIEKNTTIAAVVTDLAGGIVAAARMDGVGPAAIGLAHRKATTSANFKAPLGALTDMIGKDKMLASAISTVPILILLPGASPLMDAEGPKGAIGIAGGHYSLDQAIADEITKPT